MFYLLTYQALTIRIYKLPKDTSIASLSLEGLSLSCTNCVMKSQGRLQQCAPVYQFSVCASVSAEHWHFLFDFLLF